MRVLTTISTGPRSSFVTSPLIEASRASPVSPCSSGRPKVFVEGVLDQGVRKVVAAGCIGQLTDKGHLDGGIKDVKDVVL